MITINNWTYPHLGERCNLEVKLKRLGILVEIRRDTVIRPPIVFDTWEEGYLIRELITQYKKL